MHDDRIVLMYLSTAGGNAIANLRYILRNTKPEASGSHPKLSIFSFFQLSHQFLKALQRVLEVFNDIRGEFVRIGQIVQIGE